MRHLALSLALAVLISASLFSQTSPGKQQPRSSASQVSSDPKALATAQVVLAALGGATAIGQIQSWTFQATMSGGAADGTVTYTLDRQPPAQWITNRTGSKRALMIHSFFVPAVLGAILARQVADPTFATTQSSFKLSGPANAISFARGSRHFGQTWLLDGATNLPFHVDFRSPADLGSRLTFPAEVDISDYHNVGGVLYPFRIVTHLINALPEVITIQSVVTSTVAPAATSGPISQAGDAL